MPEDLTPLIPRQSLVRRNMALEETLADLSAESLGHYSKHFEQAAESERWYQCFHTADSTFEVRFDESALVRGRPAKTFVDQPLCCVRGVRELYLHNFSPTFKDDVSARDFVEKARGAESIPITYFFGCFQSGRKVFWLTPYEPLMDHLYQVEREQRANLARDLLGLSLDPETLLAVVVFPPNSLNEVAVPTTIDGGTHPAFCRWLAPNFDCGFTWRLDEQSRGIEELVSRPYEVVGNAAVRSRFRIEVLGETGDMPRMSTSAILDHDRRV